MMIKKTGGGGKTLGFADGTQGQKKEGVKQPERVADMNFQDIPKQPKEKNAQSSQS